MQYKHRGLNARATALSLLLVCLSSLRTSAQETQEWAASEMSHAQLMLDVVFGLQGADAARSQALLSEPLGVAGATGAAGNELGPTLPSSPTLGAAHSLLLAGSYAWGLVHLGARTAVSIASDDPAANASVATLSNTEVEAERAFHLADDTEVSWALGLILPTSNGHEPEDDLSAESPQLTQATHDPSDRHAALSEAAAAARGFEDGALFRAERIGLIPKIRLLYEHEGFRVESYIKLENLLSTRTAPHHRYLGELVVAGFYGYDVIHDITLGVRFWSNVLLERTQDTNLVCEPQLRVQRGPIQGLLGALIPLVNRPNTPTGLTGLRLAAAALF